MRPSVLAELVEARARRLPCVLATRLADGEQVLLTEAAAGEGALGAAARDLLEQGRSETRTMDGEEWFLHLHAPPPRLLVVGAVHIAQSLVPMARFVGADILVCDPRGRYATEERFPGTVLRVEWPEMVVPQAGLDRWSAMVALTHDPKIDDPALVAALATPCGYIGALGSGRSQRARLERLATAGVPAADLARVRGPVGLDLRAVGPAEIALSIVAEWVAVRRGGAGRTRPAL